MAQTPEAAVKVWLERELRKEFGHSIWLYKAPGGRFGKKGVHDFICCILGLFVSIEVKANDRCHMTKMQENTAIDIMTAKGIAVCIQGKDIDALKQLKDKIYERTRHTNNQLS